jgi:hypothetical protein
MGLMLSTSVVSAKDYSLKLSDPAKAASLEVSVMKGSITVVGYEGDTIEISSNTEAMSNVDTGDRFQIEIDMDSEDDDNNGKQRSSAGLKRVSNNASPIRIEERNNNVEISSHSRNQLVNISVKVPYSASVNLQVHKGGDIKVSDVNGAMELANHKGAIYADGVTGPIIAETHKQDIEVTFKSLSQDTPSSLTSHKGNIDISVTAAVKAKIEVQTYKGEIFSGLEQAFAADEEVKHERKRNGQEITIGGLMSAKVNGGGQTLTINTYKGNIYVRQK